MNKQASQILFVGAHLDDEVGLLLTLIKHRRQGDKVVLLYSTLPMDKKKRRLRLQDHRHAKKALRSAFYQGVFAKIS